MGREHVRRGATAAASKRAAPSTPTRASSEATRSRAATGATCSNGYCSATCSDECARAGEVQCAGGGVATCGAFDADPCLEWGDPVACEADRTCVGGACVETCTSECGPIGARVCATGGYRSCGDDDGDGCLTWSDAPPSASFTVTPSTSNIAILDAGAAWDRETADDALEVRWDLQADGAWTHPGRRRAS